MPRSTSIAASAKPTLVRSRKAMKYRMISIGISRNVALRIPLVRCGTVSSPWGAVMFARVVAPNFGCDMTLLSAGVEVREQGPCESGRGACANREGQGADANRDGQG